MPKFVIELESPDVGKVANGDLKAISQESRDVLQAMGPEIQWLQSFVTDDKIYCIYIAPNEDSVSGGLMRKQLFIGPVSLAKTCQDPQITSRFPHVWDRRIFIKH